MQFSTIFFALASVATADDVSEGTVTFTNYITKVVSQRTTYVPMAVTFQEAILNNTDATSTGNATTSTAVPASATASSNVSSNATASSNTTSGATSSSIQENGAGVAGIAGLAVACAGAALLL